MPSPSFKPPAPLVAIVNQSMAAKYFGAVNPIGRYYLTRDGHKLSAPVRIAGVVKDSKYGDLREDISPVAYLAWRQDAIPSPYANFELRTAGGAPTALIAGAKSAIAQVDRGISIEFTTLANQVDASIERERLLAVLSGSFGALALSLAMIGLYGVMSYNVARRRNEIGIRIALGAEQTRLLRMVLGEAALLIGAGLTL